MKVTVRRVGGERQAGPLPLRPRSHRPPLQPTGLDYSGLLRGGGPGAASPCLRLIACLSFAEAAVAEREELRRANQRADWHVLRGGHSSLRAAIKVRGNFLFSLEFDLTPHPVYFAHAVPAGSTVRESGLGCVRVLVLR